MEMGERKFQGKEGSSTNEFRRQKPRFPGLSHGVVCVVLHLAVLIQYRCVSHTQTDTRWWLLRLFAHCWRRAGKKSCDGLDLQQSSTCGRSVRHRLRTLTSVELSSVREDNSDTETDSNTDIRQHWQWRHVSIVTHTTAEAATSRVLLKTAVKLFYSNPRCSHCTVLCGHKCFCHHRARPGIPDTTATAVVMPCRWCCALINAFSVHLNAVNLITGIWVTPDE